MKLLEIMERSGMVGRTAYAISYVKDALQEIAELSSVEPKQKTTYTITSGQRHYALPSANVEVKHIWVYDSDTEEYFWIPRIFDVPHPDTNEYIDSASSDSETYILILS